MLALHRLVRRSRHRCSLGFRLRIRIVPAVLLFMAWSPAHPAFASKLDRDLALGVALSALLALATFSSALRLRHSVDDTLLVHVLLGAKDLPDLHKHLVVRVKAVGVEHKVVGKVSVFLIGTLRQRSENHSALGVFVDMLPRDRVVLPQLFLELVESCNDVIKELEVEDRLVPAQVSALPLRLVLLSELSPKLESAIRVHEFDLVHGPILQEHCKDAEELPVAPVVSGIEIDVVETLIGILRDLQQLVVPGVDGAKVRFHLQ